MLLNNITSTVQYVLENTLDLGERKTEIYLTDSDAKFDNLQHSFSTTHCLWVQNKQFLRCCQFSRLSDRCCCINCDVYSVIPAVCCQVQMRSRDESTRCVCVCVCSSRCLWEWLTASYLKSVILPRSTWGATPPLNISHALDIPKHIRVYCSCSTKCMCCLWWNFF